LLKWGANAPRFLMSKKCQGFRSKFKILSISLEVFDDVDTTEIGRLKMENVEIYHKPNLIIE
jgi:hypothetical protein